MIGRRPFTFIDLNSNVVDAIDPCKTYTDWYNSLESDKSNFVLFSDIINYNFQRINTKIIK